MDEKTPYTLHYFPFSLYSLAARMAFVIGQALNPATAPDVKIKLVNLQQEENLSEEYLVEVNRKGQVPALTSPQMPSALDDSHDIIDWLCERQPELIPEEHRETIERLVQKMYAFHALPFAIKPEDRKYGIPNQAAEKLEHTDISEEHRRALEIRSLYHESTLSRTLDPDNVADVERKAADFAADLSQVLEQHNAGGTWIFGERPTIIDALAAAFMARLIDTNQEDLVPEKARAWGRKVMATPEWNKVTHGRRTVWDVPLGPVADMDPL